MVLEHPVHIAKIVSRFVHQLVVWHILYLEENIIHSRKFVASTEHTWQFAPLHVHLQQFNAKFRCCVLHEDRFQ